MNGHDAGAAGDKPATPTARCGGSDALGRPDDSSCGRSLVVVPAGLQMPVSLTAQGAVLYVGSITGPYEWAVSDALRLTLQ